MSIAGQIPLVPATMALPADGGIPLQLALSLQHLWRIGLDLGVQWWGSAVAYFPSSDGPADMARKAKLAGAAWNTAHGEEGEDEDEDDENGPDLWDRKFDARYMTFGSETPAVPKLPQRDVVVASSGGCLPPVFAAEVAELPRGAGVEWHAHVGFAGISEGAITVRRLRTELPGGVARVHQTILRAGGVHLVQTVVAEELQSYSGGGTPFTDIDGVARAALASLGDVAEAIPAAAPRYVDVATHETSEEDGPVVPCASLWDASGRRLASVAVYQAVFEKLL